MDGVASIQFFKLVKPHILQKQKKRKPSHFAKRKASHLAKKEE